MRNIMGVGAIALAAAALFTLPVSAQQPPAAARRGISLADMAGRWNVRAMPATGDSTLVTYQLVATADTTGWNVTFPNRPPIAARVVAVAGDSIVTEVGPYQSVLRKGVTVWTRNVSRLHGGNLVGTFTAHYSTSGPDSLFYGRHEGMRAR